MADNEGDDMPGRDDSPLDYVGVSEAACQRRTKEITVKIEGVGAQVAGLDKKLDVHLAGLRGADKQDKRLQASAGLLIAILMALIALGGIVWGAAKMAQPDVRELAKLVKSNE